MSVQMKKERCAITLASVFVLAGTLLLTGCDGAQQQPPAQPPARVGVVTLKAESLAVTTELPGRTSAFRIAEVRPQVNGIVLKRQFTEGGEVKMGESLYQIDPAPYQAAYDAAKGDLARAEASAQLAALTVKRYKPLLATHYVSQQDYDNAVATARQANASVQSAKAALETASINLQYTKVTSPISGRIGKSSVTEGALVSAGQPTALASVQQLDPIYVDVTQSSTELLRLKKEMASGKLQQVNGKASVELRLEDGSVYPHKGTLEFSEVTVDESTGSVTLRAIFPNPEKMLLPGMFVRANLDEGIRENAILAPQQGVTRNPRGEATALVVSPDGKAEVRVLDVAQAIGDKWLVNSGLQAGDRVIVSGLVRLMPGTSVMAEEYQAPAAPGVATKNATPQTGKAQ